VTDTALLTSTRILEVTSVLITGLAAATGISRAFITTGEIADDVLCDLLALTVQGRTQSHSFPQERYPQEWNRTVGEPGEYVIMCRVEAWRCSPLVGDTVGNTPGTPPTVGDITAAAAQVLSDEYAIWHYLDCALGRMYNTFPQSIGNYIIQSSTSLGPQGGSQGVAVNFQFGLFAECLC